MFKEKNKCLLAVSSACLCVLSSPDMDWRILVITAIISALIGWYIENWGIIALRGQNYKIYSFLGALVSAVSQLRGKLEGISGNTQILCVICMIVSIPILYAVYATFYNRFFPILGRWVKKNIRWLIACVIISLIVAFIYLKCTTMFYGLLNGIFSMDSSVYIETNTYSYFNAPENDVRQPLFGLIAGLVYGPFNCLQWIDYTAYAVFLGVFDPMLIMGGIALLAYGVRDDDRTAFMFFCCCAFPAILFSLSIEQYAVLWFFLTLLVCEILREEECGGVFAAAAGSLVISGALLPWCSKRKFPDFSSYLKCIISFMGTVIICGRVTILFDYSHFRVLERSYTYQGGYAEKLLQYFNFVRTVFIAPSAHMALNNQGIFEWQLKEVTEVSLIGIILVCLSVYSYVINRADKLVKISGMWCVVSAIILGYMGYGTKDNILPLYSLYFGWSYWVLVFSLFRHVGNHRFRRALFATLIGFCALYNIYSFIGMIGQGMVYYPV